MIGIKMLDPFTAWSRMATAALDAMQTGARASRMVENSQAIVSRRSDMIGDALRSPLTGDYGELGRMIPEKVQAFSESAMAIAGALSEMQNAMMVEAGHMAATMMRGRPLTIGEWSVQVSRNMTYLTRTTERVAALSSKSLSPIEKTVSQNARRLKRR